MKEPKVFFVDDGQCGAGASLQSWPNWTAKRPLPVDGSQLRWA
jgi:hypothetical protein